MPAPVWDRMTAETDAGAVSSWPMMDRPGFLIRRLHQIHVALFSEHCVQFDVTPVQYSLLCALSSRGKADQTSLAADVLLDRTTATGALARLEARRLIERVTPSRDRRARECRLTPLGVDMLANMEGVARSAHNETIAALNQADRRKLLQLMSKLVTAHGNKAVDGLR